MIKAVLKWDLLLKTCCQIIIKAEGSGCGEKDKPDLLDNLTIFAITSIIFCGLFKCFEVQFL